MRITSNDCTTLKTKVCYFPNRAYNHVKSLFDLFGAKLMWFIVVIEHLLKGFTFGGGGSGFVGTPISFLLRSYKGLNSVDIQILKTVAMTPWAIKSLLGVISDTIYIMGYNKFPYMSLALIPSIISCMTIAMMWPINEITLTVLLFMIFLHMSIADLYTEAKYSEKIAQEPKSGPALADFVWGGNFVGQIISGIMIGPIMASLSQQDLHYIYLIPVVTLLISLYPTFNNWVGDILELKSSDSDDVLSLPTNKSLRVSNIFYNLFWVRIPRSYSIPYYHQHGTLPYHNENKSDGFGSDDYNNNNSNMNNDDYYNILKESRECLLCRTYIENNTDEEVLSKIKLDIQTLHGNLSNQQLSKQIYNSYFDDSNSDIIDIHHFSPDLKPLTKYVILRHIEGVHKACVTKQNVFSFNDNNDTIEVNNEEPTITIPFVGINKEKIINEWKVFILAIIVGTISILISLMGIMRLDPLILCISSIIGSLTILASFYIFVDRRIAKIQSFILIQNMFSVSTEAATFFFFTDTIEQYPEGPHFSTFFYVTVNGLVGAICGFIGIKSYYFLMKDWTYRNIFFWNNILFMFVSLLNIILYRRWNIWCGIPDYVFVLGAETFQTIISMWTYMPATIMISQLCPKGLEATIFAILAGSSNLGNAFAGYQGAFLLQILNITPDGSFNESEKFKNLWIASAISSILPCIPLILIKFLVPDALQTEYLLDKTEEEVKEEEEEVDNNTSSDMTLHSTPINYI